MNWISCHSKFEGNCSVCSQKIPVDELIEWDSESSLIRHQHCAKEAQIKNLIKKSQELEEQGKQKKSEEILAQAEHLEFQNLEEKFDPANVIPSEEKIEKFKEKLESTELKQNAKKYDYSEFLKEFKKLYISLTKEILGNDAYVQLSKNLRNPEKEKKFNQKTVIRYYTEWTKRRTILISNDTPDENRRQFRMLFSECNDYIHWNDRYIDEEAVDYLLAGYVPEKINEIKILFSIFVRQIDSELKRSFEKITQEMSEKNITCKFRVITNKDLHSTIHDRFISGSNISWNTPSIGQIKKNQLSEITESENHEKIEKEFDRYWNDPSCLDLFADWTRINAKLEMDKLARKYVRNCTICGRQTIVRNFVIAKNMPPKCKDCLHVK